MRTLLVTLRAATLLSSSRNCERGYAAKYPWKAGFASDH